MYTKRKIKKARQREETCTTMRERQQEGHKKNSALARRSRESSYLPSQKQATKPKKRHCTQDND
jgi:hypothetical protein